jgi:hypothetical protein
MIEPKCRPEKAKDTELARSSGGTAREMMSTMEEGAMASPRPVTALFRLRESKKECVEGLNSWPESQSFGGVGWALAC